MGKTEVKKESGMHGDAWARFKRAVDVMAKSPPQHRTKNSPKKKKTRQPKAKTK